MAVADNDHTIGGGAPPVTAAQDGRPLPHLEQQPRNSRDDRRLAAAADSEIADADDRTRQALACGRVSCVPAAAKGGDARVERAQRSQCTTRNGRTTAERPPSGGSSSAMTARVRAVAPRLASIRARAAAPSRA